MLRKYTGFLPFYEIEIKYPVTLSYQVREGSDVGGGRCKVMRLDLLIAYPQKYNVKVCDSFTQLSGNDIFAPGSSPHCDKFHAEG